ncbi:MAG: hypothetical protein Q7R96_01655 [Nanoarchaeota archaeon]|nr:hypothetical protein [Nanoarchaeota archaeon]
MAKVEIIESLKNEVLKKFKGESVTIFELMRSLAESPHKGKIVGVAGGIIIKELKYQGFRFYFILEGDRLKIFSKELLIDLLIKFVRMSNKKDQQKIIEEIKHVLRVMGGEF